VYYEETDREFCHSEFWGVERVEFCLGSIVVVVVHRTDTLVPWPFQHMSIK
jgi:hypothetical protein